MLSPVIYQSCAWLSLVAAAQADTGALVDRAVQQAAALVTPSIVRIDTVGGREQLEPGMASSGATTGLIVSSDGYLVSSAFHFVSQPSSILVTLPDGRRLPGRQIATDRQRMITLLKVDADRLQVPTAAPRETFRVGQWAIALGRTFDSESPSISVGIVSALDRVWGKAIQTDAKVSPVNYGGPLVDIQGNVLGVLAPLSPHESGETAGVEWYDSGIGFAVPLVDILAVVDRLRTGDDLLPGLMGVTFKGKDLIQGEPLIDKVRVDSPADEAGMQAGDRIVSIDGQPVTRLAELKQLLGNRYAGDALRFEVKRDDKTIPVELTLAGKLEPYQMGFLGILPSRNPADAGAAIRTLWPDGPAEQGGLQPKDVIEELDDTAIASPDELRNKLGDLRPGAMVSLKVRRGEETLTVPLTLAAAPTIVPDTLPSHPPYGMEERPVALKTGRISETLPGHDRDYWMYVPDSYRPDQAQTLVVFLHPSLDPMEQDALSAWRPECERRGIILLAPQVAGQTGWSPNDLEFIQDLIAHVREKYTVAERRIVVIGLGNSAPTAALLAFRQPELIHGLALIDSQPLGSVPEFSPDRQLQMYILARGKTLEAARWPASIDALREAGYPAMFSRTDEESGEFPSGKSQDELARWVDSLDRL